MEGMYSKQTKYGSLAEWLAGHYLPKIERRIKELEDKLFEIERTAVFNTPSPEPAPEETVIHAEIVRESSTPSQDPTESKIQKMRRKALKSGTKCLFRSRVDKYDHIDHPGRPRLPDIPVTIIELDEEAVKGGVPVDTADPWTYPYEIQFPGPDDLLKEGFTEDEVQQLESGWGAEQVAGQKYKSGPQKGKPVRALTLLPWHWGEKGRGRPRPCGFREQPGTLHPMKKASLEKRGSMKKENKKKKKELKKSKRRKKSQKGGKKKPRYSSRPSRNSYRSFRNSSYLL